MWSAAHLAEKLVEIEKCAVFLLLQLNVLDVSL